jgi:Right handed beta helix region/PKD domain
MKKQLILSIILFMIFVSSFSVVLKTPSAVHATYVEGTITKDTIWTLIDSPFILSNDMTIDPTATLTIEPGVQVRFGGSFSITVNGAIVANGTEERMILFTTNDPSQQDAWQTILIRGSQPSLFINCIVEGALNGTTVEGGVADIEKCTFRSNFDNGVVVHSGTLFLQDSDITNNTGNGITVGGGDQVNVQKNTIGMNRVGIVLSGAPAGTISIFQNEISRNTEAGLVVEALTFANTIVSENNVTSNGYGLSVTTDTNTYFSRNYFSNNTVGLHYSGNGFHVATFNDIFENSVALNIEPTGTVFVNAAHNFWGDNSGPQHKSLNPYAKGNSIESDERDFDFLPFLAHSFTYNNAAPSAALWTDKVLVAPYQTVTFIGTDSSDDGNVWNYFFDFNDGANSGWTPLTLANHSYSSTGTYVTSLTVEDDVGAQSAPVTTSITVADLTPLQTSVAVNNSTIPFNGESTVTVYVSTAAGSVANADITLFAVRGGTFEPQFGVTDENGYFTAKFTAPNVTMATDVRIIARASMTNYADGSDYKYVRVLPPLKIEVTPVVTSVWSEETVTFNVETTNPLGEPVQGVNLAFSSTEGNLSATTEITDINGEATFFYTAPLILSQTNVTLTIAARRSEYADTESQTYISIEPKILFLDIKATPNQVFSEDSPTIEVYVSFNRTAISGAAVSVASDAGGNFSATDKVTDSSGIVRFTYTVPLTSVAEGINANVTATASKAGFLNAENEITVIVKPKEMSLDITRSLNTTYSGTNVDIIVQATYNMTALQDTNITIMNTNGTFAPTTAITDRFGNVTFVLTAPDVNDSSNVTFIVVATKAGFLDSVGELDIPVEPRTFTFQVTPSTIRAGQDETLTVHLTSTTPPSDADAAFVTMSYNGGQPSANVTDVNGTCTFVINVPQTPDNQANITLTAERVGYRTKQVTITLNVVPSEGGFSWITILILIIPIIVVAVVVALIKMKVIVFSSKDEEEGSE